MSKGQPILMWNKLTDKEPSVGERVLTYSKVYVDTTEMAFRIIDSQFIHICNEVTHWCYLEEPYED